MDIRKDHVWGSFLSGALILAGFVFTMNRQSIGLWVSGIDLEQHLDVIRFVFLSVYLAYICLFGTLGFRKALRKGMNAPLWGAVCIASGIIGYIAVLFWRDGSSV